MFLQELKKIWKKERIALFIIIVVLFSVTFLLPQIKFLKRGEKDSAGVSVALTKECVTQYGEQITAQEYEEVRQHYFDALSEGQSIIATEPYFAENHVFTYEDYLEYEQNALNGVEGYDYGNVRKMRDFISQNTDYSAMYYQEYERLIQDYEESMEAKEYDIEITLSGKAKQIALETLDKFHEKEGQGSPLPYEFMAAGSRYLVNLSILCVISTLFIASPVMVIDNVNNMRSGQWSSRKGSKIYRCQFMCMAGSLATVVIVILAGGLLGWFTTGAFFFGKCSMFSFLSRTVPLLQFTYAEYIMTAMGLIFILTNGIGYIVFYLSDTSHNYIEMLMKTLPVIFVGIIVSLSLEDAFFHTSYLFRLTSIKGAEFVPAALLFIIGIFLNYRKRIRIGRERQL